MTSHQDVLGAAGSKKFHWRIKRSLISGILILTPITITLLIIFWLFSQIRTLIRPLVVQLLGMISTRVMGKRLINFIEDLIKRVPLAGGLYGASKQVVESLGGSDKPVYKSVVLVEFPRTGYKALGFLTGFVLMNKSHRYAKVIIPTAPNPTTGFFELVPEDQIEKVNITVEEAFKMILSVGLVSPEDMIVSTVI